ncbi:Retrovirus-related Pol polyprotein from transposon TNT 1-94 [Sesamum angolense]|uniref:Retrovirus-related Pol polyprotein from transposon TNT 1-94 n=1 Tax=Sesamum angolense TaxID=2727404 RepID=A0AAE1X3K3_9LAMI|nr:Retrovirus-related Pol polyprotein from transposon TNT 1-94 [Sesamum angolense]
MDTSDIVKDFDLNSINGAIDQDNVIEPPIQETVTEKQTPTPQEPLPLRRSTRERRSALPDDYIVFLQEHEVDIGMMKDDPINFHQAMECSNSEKWIYAMNEEINGIVKDFDINSINGAIDQDNVIEPPIQETVTEKQTPRPQEPLPLRRSTRERRSALPDDYIVFLQEHEIDIGMMKDDPINFHQAMECSNSQKWIDAMNEKIKSMKDKDVWELVQLPEDTKPIGCKWIFKTKRDSKGNVERYKTRLVAKGYTQKVGIDYKETFSPVSSKDSLRIIMALVAHFDLELHQMDLETTFLNGDIDEMIIMMQPENFVSGDPKNMVCRLKKSIYGLKQASRQWYFKFHQVIISFGFEMNVVDDCVYHKFCGSKQIFLVLYVDDILLASNDIGLLHETKRFLAKNFEMKDLGEASYVLGIEIHRNRSRGILRLSQKNYIEKVLKRYGMQDCKPGDIPVTKGDKFSLK